MIDRAVKTTITGLLLFFSTVPVVFGQDTSLVPPEIASPAATPTPEAPIPIEPVFFTVSPTVVDLRTDPGKPTTTTLKIRNHTNQPEAIKMTLAKLVTDSTGTKPIITNFAPEDKFQSWVTFSEPQFIIPPGEWKSVEMTFNPPPGAAFGYYFTAVFNRAKDAEVKEGESLMRGAPAIPVLAAVYSPNAVMKMDLVEFSTDKSWYEFLPVNFHIRFRNSGNVHLAPFGNIFVDSDSFGQRDLAILKVNTEAGYILPFTERDYYASWDDGFPVYVVEKNEQGDFILDNKGEPKKDLKWDFSRLNRFRIGRYSATLLAAYDNGEKDIPVEATVSFWVIPWRILLAVLIIFLILIYGITSLTKKLLNSVKLTKKSPPPVR